MLASLLTVATQSDPDSTTRTRIDCQDITSKQDKTPTSRRSSWTTRRCRPLLQARSPSLTTSRPILLRTHGQGGIAKPRRSPHRREVLCEVRWPMPTWWWCCQAPELARSRDYFSRASRWGGAVSGSTLLSRCLTTAPRREHLPPPLALARALVRDVIRGLNPLISPHPPSLRRHLSRFSESNKARDRFTQSRETGSCVTWLPPLIEADPRIRRSRDPP